MAEVVQSIKSRQIRAPVYGAGADLAAGALLMPGVTEATNDGVLINCTSTSNANAVGILNQALDYSATGECLVDGSTWFYPKSGCTEMPARWVELIDSATLVKVPWDLDDTMAVASVSTVTITITSIEDPLGSGFLYLVSGTGLGQLEFISSSDGSDLTMVTAYSTTPDNTTAAVKILPLYHTVAKWDVATTTDYTKFGTDAAAGTGRIFLLERYIVRNGLCQLLDPDAHGGLTGLNSLARFQIYGLAQITHSGFHPIE